MTAEAALTGGHVTGAQTAGYVTGAECSLDPVHSYANNNANNRSLVAKESQYSQESHSLSPKGAYQNKERLEGDCARRVLAPNKAMGKPHPKSKFSAYSKAKAHQYARNFLQSQ